jgi:hypothetical protein
MATWYNEDGLNIKYGTERGVSMAQEAGEYTTFADKREIEFELDLVKLTEAETIVNDTLILPLNVQIEFVEVLTQEAAADGVAIDVGLQNIDRKSSSLTHGVATADPDAILAAFATSTMNGVGERVTFFGVGSGTEDSLPASVTTGGAAIGQITTGKCHFTASRTTSTAFTSGKVLVRVGYRPLITPSPQRLAK